MTELHLAEKIIFAALIVGAVALFAFDITRLIRIVREGQPEKPRFDNLGKRLKRALGEIFLQTRVLKKRPFVGAMHAVVFFGFLLFAVETTNHFCEGFSFSLLHFVLGGFYSYYQIFMVAVSALVAVAILGLALRRFVFVKLSPDPKSVGSGLVALFIFLLMLTYIDKIWTEFFPPKANWWLHSVAILAFPALIVRSKHLHLIFEPITVFLRSFRLGDLAPLDFKALEEGKDIKLGIETAGDIPWKLRLDFLACVECKRCTDSCPAATVGQELKPADVILAGKNSLLHPTNGGGETAVIGKIISDRALGQCTSCLACENACPIGVEHSQILFGAKRAQTLSVGTGGVAFEFFKMIETSGNPFSAPAEARKELIKELAIPVFEKNKTEWALWLGCVWAYNPDFKKAVSATAKILQTAKVNFGVLAEEKCCGHHSRRQGEEMQYQTLARENIEIIKSSGATKIITACPHCLNTLKWEYADLEPDYKIEILHHSEFLKTLIDKKAIALNPKDSQKVAYHDPCYLGRFEGIFSAPRSVLRSAGLRVAEMPRNYENSLCCGGGAGGFVVESKEPRRIDQERKEEIQRTSASRLITACPECKMMLKDAADEVEDIAEAVARAIS